MIETKLSQAVQSLPVPVGGFSGIEEKARLIQRPSFRSRRKKMAAVLACMILLTGSIVAAGGTEIRHSAWRTGSASWADAEKIGRKLNVVLPRSVNGSSFSGMSTMYVVPEGTTYLEAIITPAYRWYAIDYGDYSLAVGSTENALWQYVFSADGSPDNIASDSLRVEEYAGVFVQGSCIRVEPDGGEPEYWHRMVWTDPFRNVVFSLSEFVTSGEDAERPPVGLEEIAKDIIDLQEDIPK